MIRALSIVAALLAAHPVWLIVFDKGWHGPAVPARRDMPAGTEESASNRDNSTAPTTQAGSPDSRAAIDADIRDLLRSADEAGEKPLETMTRDAEALAALAARIADYLRNHSADPDRDSLTLARWKAIYLAATLRGESLSELSREIDERLKADPSSELRDEAEYWRLRMAVNQIRAKQVRGQSDGAEAVVLMRAFVEAHPASPHAVMLSKEVIEALFRRGDLAGAADSLEVLRRHHPNHAVTRSLVGMRRLLESVGQPWRPALTALDGRPLDWSALDGGPAIVIFWSPTHTPSRRLLQIVRDFRASEAVRIGVVTIAVHRNAEAVVKVLSELGVDFPAALEKDAWRSKVIDEYGIRTLPTALMLDNEGRLVSIFAPRGWNMRADFEAAARSFLGIATTQPSSAPGP